LIRDATAIRMQVTGFAAMPGKDVERTLPMREPALPIVSRMRTASASATMGS
jgi:hypothetical protein